MPQWRRSLTEEQRWYLVNFLRTLPKGEQKFKPIQVQDYRDEAFGVNAEGKKKDKQGEVQKNVP